jgi:ABC-type dipeptide/oligopeptide/nickel transport system permease subunit
MRYAILTFSLIVLASGVLAKGTMHETSGSNSHRQIDTKSWWTEQTSGLIGGIAGVTIGTIGAVIGILAGMGVARKVCLSLLVLMFVFGIASLVLAIAAFAYSQPYAVYYPPLLMGVICLPLAAILFFPIKRGYEYRELRKMQAMDMK